MEVNIGIISDLDDRRASQQMTGAALKHVAGQLAIEIQPTWLTTRALANQAGKDYLNDFNSVWPSRGYRKIYVQLWPQRGF